MVSPDAGKMSTDRQKSHGLLGRTTNRSPDNAANGHAAAKARIFSSPKLWDKLAPKYVVGIVTTIGRVKSKIGDYL